MDRLLDVNSGPHRKLWRKEGFRDRDTCTTVMSGNHTRDERLAITSGSVPDTRGLSVTGRARAPHPWASCCGGRGRRRLRRRRRRRPPRPPWSPASAPAGTPCPRAPPLPWIRGCFGLRFAGGGFVWSGGARDFGAVVTDWLVTGDADWRRRRW